MLALCYFYVKGVETRWWSLCLVCSTGRHAPGPVLLYVHEKESHLWSLCLVCSTGRDTPVLALFYFSVEGMVTSLWSLYLVCSTEKEELLCRLCLLCDHGEMAHACECYPPCDVRKKSVDVFVLCLWRWLWWWSKVVCEVYDKSVDVIITPSFRWQFICLWLLFVCDVSDKSVDVLVTCIAFHNSFKKLLWEVLPEAQDGGARSERVGVVGHSDSALEAELVESHWGLVASHCCSKGDGRGESWRSWWPWLSGHHLPKPLFCSFAL